MPNSITDKTRDRAVELVRAGKVPYDTFIPTELYNGQDWPAWAIQVMCMTEDYWPQFRTDKPYAKAAHLSTSSERSSSATSAETSQPR